MQASLRAMGQEDWGEAAFERIAPLLDQVDEDALASTNTNIAQAALAAIGVARQVMKPALYARFQALPPAEFDMAHVDGLSDRGWGTLYAAMEVERMRYVLTRSRLPEDLLAPATELEKRMQACCEYHLADHPTAGPEVARLREGRGHHDLAADLHGYAKLYKTYRALLEGDQKHYRASDVADALRFSKEIFTLLSDSLTERERSVSAQLVRAWTLLVQSYDEVSAAGRFLFRNDTATADQMFPSLFAMGRTARSPRRGDDAPAADVPVTPVDLPAGPPVAQA